VKDDNDSILKNQQLAYIIKVERTDKTKLESFGWSWHYLWQMQNDFKQSYGNKNLSKILSSGHNNVTKFSTHQQAIFGQSNITMVFHPQYSVDPALRGLFYVPQTEEHSRNSWMSQ
jgi:hypothetical protein